VPSGAEAEERQPAPAAAALPSFLCVLVLLAPSLLEPIVLDLLLNLVLVLHVRLLDVISAERRCHQRRSRARGGRLSLRPCLPAN